MRGWAGATALTGVALLIFVYYAGGALTTPSQSLWMAVGVGVAVLLLTWLLYDAVWTLLATAAGCGDRRLAAARRRHRAGSRGVHDRSRGVHPCWRDARHHSVEQHESAAVTHRRTTPSSRLPCCCSWSAIIFRSSTAAPAHGSPPRYSLRWDARWASRCGGCRCTAAGSQTA